MANVFKPKRSNTASSVPTTSDLIDGELAVNSADQKIYIRDSSSILEIGDVSPWKTSGYTGIGTTSTVGIGTRIEIIPYDTQNGGTLSFEGSAGQLFSISNNLTSGSIFSVNDVSGIPSIDVDADGTIQLAPITSTEFVGIGTTNPIAKLDVNGNVNITGVVTATGFATDTGTSSQFLKADGSVDSSTYLTSAATEAFKTIAVSGQSDVVADLAADTLTLVAGSNMTITTNASTDTITFASSGSSGISSVSEDTTPQLGGTLDTNGNLIRFGDSGNATVDRLKFGAGDDLQLWHNGSNSYVSQQSVIGDLYILSTNDDNDIIIQTDNGSGGVADYFRADGSTGEAILYHYGTAKLSTKSTGIDVSGTITGADSVASSANGMRKITASTSSPSGGADGDIWIKYTA